MSASGMPRRTVKKMLRSSRQSGSRVEGKDGPDDLTNVRRDEISDKLLGVLVDGPTLLHRALDGGKVVIGEDHIRSELGHVRSRTHRDSNRSPLERRRVIDSISRLYRHQYRSRNKEQRTMATTSPSFWSKSTICNLCPGSVRLNKLASKTAFTFPS